MKNDSKPIGTLWDLPAYWNFGKKANVLYFSKFGSTKVPTLGVKKWLWALKYTSAEISESNIF